MTAGCRSDAPWSALYGHAKPHFKRLANVTIAALRRDGLVNRFPSGFALVPGGFAFHAAQR